MPSDLDTYHLDLTQDVRACASANGMFEREALTHTIGDILLEAEELLDWTACYFERTTAGHKSLQIDGYSVEELGLDGTLHVLIAAPSSADVVETVGSQEVKSAHGRAIAFVAEALAGRLHPVIEPSDPAADFARHIFDARSVIRTLRVHLLTDAVASSRYKDVERNVAGIPKIETHIWDLARLHKMASVGGREDIDIDVTKLIPHGLSALPAGLHSDEYAAYLCVVPGTFLASIYEEYGSRILEGNVRAFLSASGKINKGIRKTIRSEPERFFAYNNGITATAGEVIVSPSGAITRIRDLQIVNGGQTTASLYNTREQDHAPLDAIFVQMKLSVVSPETARAMIPNIARFANTQNNVGEADLFANHPFNLEVEKLSRSIWAPGARGSHLMTRWFYERARAQYQTEQIKLTPAQKREFLLQNPKSQVISKTELAKVENTWRQQPHAVSLGAQKNFVKYAEHIGPEFDSRPHDFNELWFRGLVARMIVHVQTGRLVSNAPWYTGNFRANIVTYAIARTLHLIDEAFPGRTLDLEQIWKAQEISKGLEDQLLSAGQAALAALLDSDTPGANVTEWAKKEGCWKKLKTCTLRPVAGFERALRGIDDVKADKVGAKKAAKLHRRLNAVVEVVKLRGSGFWHRAVGSKEALKVLTPTELGIIRTLVSKPTNWVPSEAQARRLMEAHEKLTDEGLT